MATKDIKRKDAARLLQEVAMLTARLEEGYHSKDRPVDVANRLRTILASAGLSVPRVCNGEAHSNPHVDHCGVCMPNWGWVSETIKVK